MDNCVFCRIIQRSEPASIFYEDDMVIAIMDLNPVNTGHALVIPKTHVVSLAEMDEQAGMHLFRIAQRTAAAIRASEIRCEGINLFLADGEAAFQEVFHVHLHVFPRFAGDSFKLSADWERAPRQELDVAALKIRAAYKRLWNNDTGGDS